MIPVNRLLRATGCRLAILAAVLLLSLAGGSAQQTTSAPVSSNTNKPVEYVGSEVCQTCHEDIYKAFQKNLINRLVL